MGYSLVVKNQKQLIGETMQCRYLYKWWWWGLKQQNWVSGGMSRKLLESFELFFKKKKKKQGKSVRLRRGKWLVKLAVMK